MPTIRVQTTQSLSSSQKEELKTEFGKAIALIPGKSETWLMVLFNDNSDMFFQGNDDDETALVEVGIKGTASKSDFEKLGSALTSALNSIAKIPPSRIYISFTEFENYMFNGSML